MSSLLVTALEEPTVLAEVRVPLVNPTRLGLYTCASGNNHVLTVGVPTEQLDKESAPSAKDLS